MGGFVARAHRHDGETASLVFGVAFSRAGAAGGAAWFAASFRLGLYTVIPA
jgi:hypothetical protein